MTAKGPYKKRLQQHLKETKSHAKQVERRIKKLGGGGQTLQGAVGKLTAAAKGPLHAVRGGSEQEKMLKNAKTEYFNEHEEIATYLAIETLAEKVKRLRDGEAGAGDPPRGGADGGLPPGPDQVADRRGGARGDPRRPAARRLRLANRKKRPKRPAAKTRNAPAKKPAAKKSAREKTSSRKKLRRNAERTSA